MIRNMIKLAILHLLIASYGINIFFYPNGHQRPFSSPKVKLSHRVEEIYITLQGARCPRYESESITDG